MMRRLFLGWIACLSSASCAAETHERPVAEPHATIAREPSPMPPGAFQDSSPARGCDACDAPAPTSRFETRRIGEDAPRGSRYRGAPVDLDLKAVDVQEVFRLLADVGKVNIVVAGEVSGTVTMKLRRVPWDQALDVVATAKNLVLERDGNVILVRAR